MPRIFDNIEQQLLPALRQALQGADRADFCVGYFNLRGWRHVAPLIEEWPGTDGRCCRLLVGMQRLPQEHLRAGLRLAGDDGIPDQQAVLRLKKQMAEEFRDQLLVGAPSNRDESALRCLSAQLKASKLVVKLFLRHPLHAKLYLVHRPDANLPSVGYLGSSNLTLAGLQGQGELHVDVLDHDACAKLGRWFDDRWNDRWCLDISAELAAIIDQSWAREDLLPPYHVYLKMAYHLSQDARAGLAEFRIPAVFGDRLFDFQVAAVKIAAHHLNKRGGVLIGDVVGLGKTLMATALARILQDDQGWETLILCPKNLERMWTEYRCEYGLIADVLPFSRAIQELPNLRRYRVVLIDESHNLRNREGKTYRAIQDYIQKNDSRCILLSATPYNKSYLDLSAQLRLFVSPDEDLGARPERKLREVGELTFAQLHQCSPRSLAASEKSEHPDDWRDLMRRYLVRRTRSFIQQNYAEVDGDGRRYLTMADGTRSHFPARVPRTVRFAINDQPNDPYALLYAPAVVNAVNDLRLPRYGLGNYVDPRPAKKPSNAEEQVLAGLSRAGVRLMGFSRTNLFKRLESGGPAFIQSVERHILRNFVFLHALDRGLDLPLGSQGADLLDGRTGDRDLEDTLLLPENDLDDTPVGATHPSPVTVSPVTGSPTAAEEALRHQAESVYATYAGPLKRRFTWVRSSLFRDTLREDLLADARKLLGVLAACGRWDADRDPKLAALVTLLAETHPNDKSSSSRSLPTRWITWRNNSRPAV